MNPLSALQKVFAPLVWRSSDYEYPNLPYLDLGKFSELRQLYLQGATILQLRVCQKTFTDLARSSRTYIPLTAHAFQALIKECKRKATPEHLLAFGETIVDLKRQFPKNLDERAQETIDTLAQRCTKGIKDGLTAEALKTQVCNKLVEEIVSSIPLEEPDKEPDESSRGIIREIGPETNLANFSSESREAIFNSTRIARLNDQGTVFAHDLLAGIASIRTQFNLFTTQYGFNYDNLRANGCKLPERSLLTGEPLDTEIQCSNLTTELLYAACDIANKHSASQVEPIHLLLAFLLLKKTANDDVLSNLDIRQKELTEALLQIVTGKANAGLVTKSIIVPAERRIIIVPT